ncbi:hypothetical protein LCGC14_1018340 [marine sediment metagenome]|uniref:Lipoprotein n=1 Tax=marine sediment metagenome TaxID=412755 RepID=A0A0F9QGE6_9ZZZZ
MRIEWIIAAAVFAFYGCSYDVSATPAGKNTHLIEVDGCSRHAKPAEKLDRAAAQFCGQKGTYGLRHVKVSSGGCNASAIVECTP